MKSKKILLISFILLCIAQLYIPARMIMGKEVVLKEGEVFKFITAPIDPNDPLRGKYIDLDFALNTIRVQDYEKWEYQDRIFLYLEKDNQGFAEIASVTKQPYDDENQNYLEAKVWWSDSTEVRFELPFSRFYMEESKAYEAEVNFREAQRDTSNTTYALVCILEGEAVIQDVMIGNVPIKEVVLMARELNSK